MRPTVQQHIFSMGVNFAGQGAQEWLLETDPSDAFVAAGARTLALIVNYMVFTNWGLDKINNKLINHPNIKSAYAKRASYYPLFTAVVLGMSYYTGQLKEHTWVGDFCLMALKGFVHLKIVQRTPHGVCTFNLAKRKWEIPTDQQGTFYRVEKEKKWTNHSQVLQEGQLSPVYQALIRTVSLLANYVLFSLAAHKLMCIRNSSLLLRPYLYYGASIGLLNNIVHQLIDPRLQGNEKESTVAFVTHKVIATAFRVGAIALSAAFVYRQTGTQVEISKTCTALTFLASQVVPHLDRVFGKT